jgi:hypothetical protein
LDDLERSCQFASQVPAGNAGLSSQPERPGQATPPQEAPPQFSYSNLCSRDYEQILKAIQ